MEYIVALIETLPVIKVGLKLIKNKELINDVACNAHATVIVLCVELGDM